MDFEKAFNSLDRSFLISVLRRFGGGKKIITWLEVSLDQQSCVINCKTTIQYFNGERGAHQGDPVLVHFFILIL